MAHDVAFFQLEGGAHELQALQVLVHRTRADGAAAGQGHAGLADAGQQRAQAEHRGPHGAHQIIGGLGQQAAGRQLHAVLAVAAGAAQHVQELDGGMDVAQVGHVGVDQGRVQQDAGKKNGQGGILGAADIYGPFERRTAFDNELVHQDPRAACGPGPRRMLGVAAQSCPRRGRPVVRQNRYFEPVWDASFFSKKNPERELQIFACIFPAMCVYTSSSRRK